ncbi:MAG: GatB/YqeY domain-containing protein [bacterium]
MNLKEKIEQDLKQAFKAKEEARVSVLRMLSAAIKNREVEKRTKLSKSEKSVAKLEELSVLNDEEMIGVVSSEIKKMKEAAEQYKQGSRAELAAKEEAEIKILAPYMPEQLAEEEVRKIVAETIKETGIASVAEMGKLMGALMPKIKGKADGNLVSKVVKEQLDK